MQFGGDSIDFKEIDLDGFQVVSADMFSRQLRPTDPTCTIWYNSISFNKVAISSLNNCERIRIEINPQRRGVLIVPVTEKDKDSIRWSKNIKEPVARRIECGGFTSQLFKMWEWDPERVYRATGRLVLADQKVMLLYDFSKPEHWKYRAKMKDTE